MGVDMKSRKMLLAFALTVLVFFPMSGLAAPTVDVVGDTATHIWNLDVDGTLFNVAFLFISANDLYGNPPGFDFNSEDAVDANVAVRGALNTYSDVQYVGSSNAPQDRDSEYAIGNDVEPGFVVVARSKYDPSSNQWVNEFPLQYPEGAEKMYADFTVVPVPAAVWLLGGGLVGLFGLRRRFKN